MDEDSGRLQLICSYIAEDYLTEWILLQHTLFALHTEYLIRHGPLEIRRPAVIILLRMYTLLLEGVHRAVA
jgi:hypothetical protein